MTGPDKESKFWVVQNSRCWDSACRSGLQFVQMTWMCRASYVQWRLQLPPWHVCRQKETTFVGGTCFFLDSVAMLRQCLFFDHKYPWVLWCAMATCILLEEWDKYLPSGDGFLKTAVNMWKSTNFHSDLWPGPRSGWSRDPESNKIFDVAARQRAGRVGIPKKLSFLTSKLQVAHAMCIPATVSVM